MILAGDAERLTVQSHVAYDKRDWEKVCGDGLEMSGDAGPDVP